MSEDKTTPPYLIKDGKQLFGYTPFLAERTDMKPFYGTPEDFKRGSNLNTKEQGESPERILKILGAFDGLSEDDFISGGQYKGLPKIDALRTLLNDYSITTKERDEAWKQRQKPDEGKA